LTSEKLSNGPQTLIEALERRASTAPDRVAYRFLREGEVEHDSITFGELRRRARAAAGRLLALRSNNPGDAAILLYPQGIEFIVAFFGCLYAGVMAVPASIANRKRAMDILGRIAEDAGARWILSTGTQLEHLARDAKQTSTLANLECVDLGEAGDRLPLPVASVKPGAIAMLQYTSGSTGMPSGVAITHANLADNQKQMERSFEHDDDTVFVTWLPMFHDMGLGTVLMAVWTGRPCVIMSPGVFVQNPRRWLAAISHYRGTTSLAPDFAYDLCVRRITAKEREGLDLSSWRVAVNGSEPVRSQTIERFIETFAACGFRREAFVPAYGLAESTLYVASEGVRTAPVLKRFSKEELEHGQAVLLADSSSSTVLVSCGRPPVGSTVLIVDPDTRRECPPGTIGEIWIGSASVGAGYWKKELETKYTFRASTLDGRGPFLRTGDLGFINEARLFVAGRHKDLIIIRGRNHSPQDIEDSVSTCHPALVARGCAAFSIDTEEGERLVVVQEVGRTSLRTLDAPGVFRAIRSVISDNHALQTHAIVLLKPSSLPRTTSGKVRRKTCRQNFLDNSLPAVASWGGLAHGEISPGGEANVRDASLQADRLIEWIRTHAVELTAPHSGQDRDRLSSALSGTLVKQGLLGMQVEVRYGGLGLGHFDTCRVLEQLAAVDFSLAMLVGANTCLGVQPIARHASAQHKPALLPGLARGQEFAAFAFDERDQGSGQPGTEATLRLEGEDPWRLYGSRDFNGASPNPNLINLVACHEEPPGASAFVVARGAEGVRLYEAGAPTDTIGFARTVISFDGTPVVREDLLGSFGSGSEVTREATLHMRLTVGAACIGAMKRCAQLVSRDVAYRPINGKATPNPVILSRLSSAAARVTALECLVHAIARATDMGRAVPAEGFAACKLLGPEMLLRSIDDLMLIGVKVGHNESNQVLGIYKAAGSLRNFDGPPEALAEATGAAVMEEDTPLRLLIEDILSAPAVVSWVDPVIEAVRHRMKNLKGALARRAERWGHTRAGELTTWLALLAAVEGCLASSRSLDLEHAHSWTLAQLEHAVSAVRLGTPSETATLDADDIAATFAAYSRTIGNLATDSGRAETKRSPLAPQGGAKTEGAPAASSAHEHAKRELRSRIIAWLANRLRIPVSEIEAGRSFADHGLDSVSSVELAKELSDILGREIDPTVVWNFATIHSLTEHLLAPDPARTAPAENKAPSGPASSSGRTGSTLEGQIEDEIAKLEQELRTRT
jgi:acyl-CoA synthetase (AMP-forming)/AMP-acid ligase II/alkylation response protein AidB-like acyl-CoA dehydrogenase/acyl carrier protein